jgi:hypothetical protein
MRRTEVARFGDAKLGELMMQRRGRPWIPSALEAKCLQHLDVAENWTSILKQPRPDEAERLGWRPFRRIFFFNLVVFLVATTAVFVFVELGGGGPASNIAEDKVPGGIVIAFVSVCLAAFVTNLYRRTWNRRAKILSTPDEDEAI